MTCPRVTLRRAARARPSPHRMTGNCATRAAGWPALRTPCATTASRSGSPRRRMRWPCSLRPRRSRPSSLKPALRALFCATHSDWERFDEIFDAFWRGRHMRQRQVLTGAPGGSAPPARRLAQAHVPQDALGLPDHVERRTDGDGDAPGGRTRPPRGRLARRGADDDGPPPYRRSRRHGGDPRACGAARPGDARAAGAPRTGAPARPPPRPAPHHSSQRLAWRNA